MMHPVHLYSYSGMCSLRYTLSLVAAGLCILTLGCGSAPPTPAPSQAGPFDSDLAFLRQNTEVVVLSDPSGGAQVVVARSIRAA